jgi:hypothetical protein
VLELPDHVPDDAADEGVLPVERLRLDHTVLMSRSHIPRFAGAGRSSREPADSGSA